MIIIINIILYCIVTVPEELHRNCVIMRQLVQFYFNITKLHESPTGQGVVTDGTDTSNSLSQVNIAMITKIVIQWRLAIPSL